MLNFSVSEENCIWLPSR